MSVVGGQRQLAGSGRKPGEGEEELGDFVSVAGPGGTGPKGVADVLYRGSLGGPPLRGGYLGPHPKDGEGHGKFSFQGREEDHWEATPEKERQELGIPTAGGGKGGRGNGGDTNIHYTEA